MELPLDIRDALQTYAHRLGIFAGDITWHVEVGSTNDIAAVMAERGAAEGALVGADAQSAGRGRLGRTWSSPPGAGLYVSVVLRPPAAAVPLLTIAAGVAIADGIREATGLSPALKWPNDLYVGSRKVAGILAEADGSPARMRHVVLGFGINLSPAAHPPELAGRVTSLEIELGRPVDRGLTLAACLSTLAQRYDELKRGQVASLLEEWKRRAVETVGRRVECVAAASRVTGVVEGIDENGALLVRTASDIVRIISGELIWL